MVAKPGATSLWRIFGVAGVLQSVTNFRELRFGEVHGDRRGSLIYPIALVRRAYHRRGHITLGRLYQSLMYSGPPTSHTIHKKPYCIEPGAGNRKPEKPGCRSSEGGVRWRPGLPIFRLYYREG